MEELNGYWPDGMEDELIRELVGDESPFFMSPQTTDSEASVSPRPLTNLPLSTVYPGPRIKDIESALSVPKNKGSVPQPRISIMEKGLSKIENKYTLKIKTCVNGLTDDGYKWRKYGQKSIKNSLNPRSYYRCTNPRCSAKKQVEKCSEDPETLIVTYEGLHLHFAYPHFFQAPPQYVNSPTKKPKNILRVQEALAEKESNGVLAPTPSSTITKESQQEPIKEVEPQGLLEDVVPLMIRNPSNRSVSNSSCSSSYPSSPPTSSSSSLSWSPTYSSCFDASIISSMR